MGDRKRFPAFIRMVIVMSPLQNHLLAALPPAIQQRLFPMLELFPLPLGKVLYDGKLQVVKHALGTHTSISRVHGGRLKASREIRIASVFRDTPAAFLRMIVVHELAHLREPEHDKAFYQLCTHIEPDYHQLELDLRLYLTARDAGESIG